MNDINARMHALIRDCMETYKLPDTADGYREGLHLAMTHNPDAAAEYAGLTRADAVPSLTFGPRFPLRLGKSKRPENPSRTVDARTREHMKANGERDYRTALGAVLKANPDLKRAYARS